MTTVEKSALGRLLDPADLDASGGPRARLRVEVPMDWLEEDVELVVTAPARLTCAHCDGGGCDACGRSGALRAPEEPEARVVRTSVGAYPGGAGLTIRIAQPFGAGSSVDQLLVDVIVGDVASPGVARVPRAAPESASRGALASWPAAAFTVTSIAALVAVLFELLGR